AVKMSDKNQIAATASLIEQLMSRRNFEDLGNHLTELETFHVTKEHLQETVVVRAVYRVLKTCPMVALKKKAKRLFPESFAAGGNEENPGLSHDPSQGATLGGSISNSSSHDIAEAIKMTAPENSTRPVEPEEKHLRGGDPKSADERSSELLDPTVPVRAKCTELLYEALMSSSADQPKADLCRNLARDIEEHIFTLYSKNLKKYKTCVRSKVANLKNPKSSHLQQSLLLGTMSPREFAAMTVMEMAHKGLKQLRASYTESCIQEHRLPQVLDGTHTKKIKCRRCEKFNCKVTVIARGALFLPSWVRRSNPDEETMTYVICNECGEQWYHSGWVCL
ncbi:TEANC protein, partial [Crocuta crocuta]